jgi:hypothetical protein
MGLEDKKSILVGDGCWIEGQYHIKEIIKEEVADAMKTEENVGILCDEYLSEFWTYNQELYNSLLSYVCWETGNSEEGYINVADFKNLYELRKKSRAEWIASVIKEETSKESE